MKERQGMRRGRNEWGRDGAWQCGAGQKEVGREEEETAGGANGGKGTDSKRRCGESGIEQEGEGCGTAGRGGAERVGGYSGGNGRWGEVRRGREQEREAAVLRRRGNWVRGTWHGGVWRCGTRRRGVEEETT